jgi:hypothetical protein
MLGFNQFEKRFRQYRMLNKLTSSSLYKNQDNGMMSMVDGEYRFD